MKRTTVIILLLAGCFAFGACGGGSGEGASSPGTVVKKYVTALANEDKQAALDCIAPEKREDAAPILEFGISIASSFVKSEGGLDSVTILREEVEGDKALVGYQTKTKKGMERGDTVQAEKVGGSWYIAP